MKKIFTLAAIAAVALSFTMTSCSKSAEDYVKEGLELQKQLDECENPEEQAKLKKEIDALEEEIQKKADEDPQFKEDLQKALANAVADQIKEQAK